MDIRIIGIDIDYPFDVEKVMKLIEKREPILRQLLTNYVIYIRQSSRGNTHIKIETTDNIDLLTHFMIRALFDDDAYRIRADLKRLLASKLKKRNIEFYINRLWDVKIRITKDGIKEEGKAGPWIKLKEYRANGT